MINIKMRTEDSTQRDMYNLVKFNSIAHEKFRIHLNEEEKGILKVHIKARNSKKQWKSSLQSEGNSKINGIPAEGVFRALRVTSYLFSTLIY